MCCHMYSCLSRSLFGSAGWAYKLFNYFPLINLPLMHICADAKTPRVPIRSPECQSPTKMAFPCPHWQKNTLSISRCWTHSVSQLQGSPTFCSASTAWPQCSRGSPVGPVYENTKSRNSFSMYRSPVSDHCGSCSARSGAHVSSCPGCIESSTNRSVCSPSLARGVGGHHYKRRRIQAILCTDYTRKHSLEPRSLHSTLHCGCCTEQAHPAASALKAR